MRISGSHGESSRSLSDNVGVARVRRARLKVRHEGAWDFIRPPCIRASAFGENVWGAPDVAGQDSDGLRSAVFMVVGGTLRVCASKLHFQGG